MGFPTRRDKSASEFDRVLRRHRRDAVLLHRPYPPHTGRRTNSWLGGLPALPAHYEWPRASDGTALHFFAQIDCADIGFRTPLPERGVLFFFGRDDDNHLWNDGGPASDDCRVLYALDAPSGTPRREAPADLQQLGGEYPHTVWPGYAHEGGRGPSVRDEWPIHPLPMPSWPDALPGAPDPRMVSLYGYARHIAPSARVWNDWKERLMGLLGFEPDEDGAQAEERHLAYKKQLDRLQVDAFARATGEGPVGDPRKIMPEVDAGRSLFLSVEQGPDAYPQYWSVVRHCALAVLYRPGKLVAFDAALEAPVASAAEEWLRRANQAGLDAPVREEERTAFRAWITSLRPPGDQSPLSLGAAGVIFASVYATVRDWAGDPSRAARLTPSVYETVRWAFSPFRESSVSFWQMLGHAPSPQYPLPPEDPTVCLLTDPGGFCKFWIDPGDLAWRDFSRVWGTVEVD